MIIKSYNYKAVPLNSNSRGNNEVTHDFPEEYIVSMDNIALDNRDETIGALKRSYLYMDKTDYNYIKPVIIWPTYTLNVIDVSDYEGAFVVRTIDEHDVLCYIEKCGEVYRLWPIDYLIPWKQRVNHEELNHVFVYRFPKRNIKCFLKKEDYEKDLFKKCEQAEKNYAKYVDKKEELCNIPTFALTSPKFKIISVVKKTKWLTAKEGDVIYGSLPVIETDNQGVAHKLLKGIGTQTNYIKVYVNGKFERQMGPLDFPKLFLENYKVEII